MWRLISPHWFADRQYVEENRVQVLSGYYTGSLFCRHYDSITIFGDEAFQIKVQCVICNHTSIYLILSDIVCFSSNFRTTHWWHVLKQHKK